MSQKISQLLLYVAYLLTLTSSYLNYNNAHAQFIFDSPRQPPQEFFQDLPLVQPTQNAPEKPKKPKIERDPTAPSPAEVKRKTERIANPIAVFDGLDKVTARITNFDTEIGRAGSFGALKITPRVCYTRPYSDTPQTSAFVEVDEITLIGDTKRIFTGWMFAASPSINGVEHPVFDVWLTGCKGGNQGEIKDGPKTGYDGDGPKLKEIIPKTLPSPIPKPKR